MEHLYKHENLRSIADVLRGTFTLFVISVTQDQVNFATKLMVEN